MQQQMSVPPSTYPQQQAMLQPCTGQLPEPMDDLPAGTVVSSANQAWRYIVSPALLSPQDFEGTVYTFGFGSDHNGDLLTAISNAANGVYYFIDSTEKVDNKSYYCNVPD